MADYFTLKSVVCNIGDALKSRHLDDGGEVQKFIDTQVLEQCDPKVPFDQGILAESGVNNTTIGSGEVKYRTPYARRWYYMPASFQGAPERGNYWFERMKNEGGKDKILAGARKLAGAKE